MKIRTTALFATAFLAATTRLLFFPSTATATTINLTLYSEGFSESSIFQNLLNGQYSVVFLTADNMDSLYVSNGLIAGADEIGGIYELDTDLSDEDVVMGCWQDNLDPDHFGFDNNNQGSWRYLVAIRDSEDNSMALSDANGNLLWFEVVTDPEYGPDYVWNDATFEVSSEASVATPIAFYQGSWNQPPAPDLPTPVISAFSVTGQSAALSVANVQNGAFYAVYSSETPNGAKTLVECKQCDSDTTVEFSGLDATNSAKFFHVKGGDTQAAASEW